ncbi:adenosylcobinamide-GDP ribazoletransferase, partial [Candidatus Aerophobetes bacterium]|nr:adenosylcobinamide-GDP ribazoletransferase [Candidatus Aerophobetes bacterium]
MKDLLLKFQTSLNFLTVIPAGGKTEKISQDALAKSALFFPVVGILIGSLLYLFFFLVRNLFIPQITSFLILTLWIYLTGSLHIDGFADTVDGISGGKNRQEILEIMKDAHIGPKGVVAVCLLLLFKYFLIFSVLDSPRVKILIYAPCAGRYAMVLAG